MVIKDLPIYLIKHSSIEFGIEWWFLNQVHDYDDFDLCISTSILKDFKDFKRARFIKRYASEEELDIDVTLRYAGKEVILKTL